MTTVLELPTPDPQSLDEPARSVAAALRGQYAIKTMLGRGGMGIVYLARDRRLERLVAIKTLPPELAGNAAVRERFMREARTAGGLAHPNIVPIHTVDETDGHVFIVMTYIDGESLAARVRGSGPLDPATALRYLRDVASALGHAHRHGIIHRDVKAENILIDRVGDRALVSDFGIARMAEAAPLTATGQLLGTVYYVSPEQVAGDPVDARSDLYSVGVVGYLALSGRFPLDGELASAVLVSHVTRMPPPLRSVAPHVPPALAAIVDRCLAKQPRQRFASADELAAALDAAAIEMDRAPSPRPARPALVSDTEAHAVWRRAAELQAVTGVQPRPEIVPITRDRGRDDARTSGFPIADVRAAAADAGIGSPYVEHALAERGLAASRPASRPASTVAIPRSWWAGVPLKLRERRVLDGAVSPSHFDRVVDVLRDATGKEGTVIASRHELAWQCRGLGGETLATVIPDRGHTEIELTASLHRPSRRVASAAIVVGAIAGGAVAAFIGGSPTLDRLDGMLTLLALTSWAATVVGAHIVARVTTLVVYRRRRNRLKSLIDYVTGVVREGPTPESDG